MGEGRGGARPQQTDLPSPLLQVLDCVRAPIMERLLCALHPVQGSCSPSERSRQLLLRKLRDETEDAVLSWKRQETASAARMETNKEVPIATQVWRTGDPASLVIEAGASHVVNRPRSSGEGSMTTQELDESFLQLDDILDLVGLDDTLVESPSAQIASSAVRAVHPAPSAMTWEMGAFACTQYVEGAEHAIDPTMGRGDPATDIRAVIDLFAGALPEPPKHGTSHRRAPCTSRPHVYAPLPQPACSALLRQYVHHPLGDSDQSVAPRQEFLASEVGVSQLPVKDRPTDKDELNPLAPGAQGLLAESRDGLNDGACPCETPGAAKLSQGLTAELRQLLEQLSLTSEGGLMTSPAAVHISNGEVPSSAMVDDTSDTKPTSNQAKAGDRQHAERLHLKGTALRELPLPLPSLLVGCDGDPLCVSPNALFWWEKIGLHPIAMKKKLVYAVVCPESASMALVCTFCQQLTAMYQACSLGTLAPVADWLHRYKAPDGSTSEESSVQVSFSTPHLVEKCLWGGSPLQQPTAPHLHLGRYPHHV